MGDGLFEQLEVANTRYYNNFSIDKIEKALYDLCASKLDWKDRTFILRTGKLKESPHSFASSYSNIA